MRQLATDEEEVKIRVIISKSGKLASRGRPGSRDMMNTMRFMQFQEGAKLGQLMVVSPGCSGLRAIDADTGRVIIQKDVLNSMMSLQSNLQRDFKSEQVIREGRIHGLGGTT